MNKKVIFCVENLTIFSWIFSVLPELQPYAKANQGNILLYYFDATPQGLRLARFMAKFFNIDIQRLDFTLFDAKDTNGDLLWWKVILSSLTGLPIRFGLNRVSICPHIILKLKKQRR